jgi:methyltransferase (TIGR00027 family)
MSSNEPTNSNELLIRNISDTARWVAAYRAMETERPDALFRDPYARQLAGEKGAEIAEAMPFKGKNMWPFTMRTYLMDELIDRAVQQGADMVINLAAGLDTRPYRMNLPASLKWVEIDLPEILAYKEEVLGNEEPRCALERVRLDLSDENARRAIFQDLGRNSKSALILSEGLLAYLTPESVGLLASDLAAPPSFRKWILDLASPGLLKMLAKQKMGTEFNKSGIPFKFAPAEGPEYFEKYGWKPVEVHSVFKKAAALKRLPFWMRFFALLPDSKETRIKRPWTGICLFEKRSV